MVTYEEEELQLLLKTFARFFPVIESLENLELFIANVAHWTAQKTATIIPGEMERGRSPDHALRRAKRWLWNLLWEELIDHPTSPIVNRTMRLAEKITASPSIPAQQGFGKYDPRLILIEYNLLYGIFSRILRPRPGLSRKRIPSIPGQRQSKSLVSFAKEVERSGKREKLATAQKALLDQLPPLSWHRHAPKVWFDTEILCEMEPNRAARTVLEKNSSRSDAAIKRDITAGRRMLPEDSLTAIDTAWKDRRHAPEVCRVLGCCTSRE